MARYYAGKRKLDSYREPFAATDESREKQALDAGMIREDRRAIANLPQEVVYRAWPKVNGGYLPDVLTYGFMDIEEQRKDDHDMMIKNMNPKKY